MTRRLLVLSLSLVLASLAADARAAGEAVRELGQPNFRGFVPNRLDARGMVQPWGVAVDTSRSPNGLWVVDAGNNRVLGWRDVTALSNGAAADVVIGQPNAISNGCNTGGLSAASLCFVESFAFHFAYEPGVAVDGEGNLYVADQFNQRILGYRRPFDTDRVADVVIGQSGFDQGDRGVIATFDPRGLAADAQGNLYISDNVRVVELDRPLATDAVADRVFGQPRLDVKEFPADPSAPDRIAMPDGVAVDGQGRLYVADAWMDRVMVWKQPLARQGAADLIFSQGGRICTLVSCDNIKGIAVAANGDVWVGSHAQGSLFGYRSPLRDGDTRPDRIIAARNSLRTSDFKPPRRAGQPALASGGLAVDSSGTLWLSDVNRVLGFRDPWHGNGRADRLLGQVRPDQLEANLVDRGGLKGPGGVTIDTGAHPPHLYVVDAINNRVLGWADAEGFSNGQPADLVLGQPDFWASGCNTGGRSLASLCLGPNYNGIAVDSEGMVWVADPGNARVLGFRSPFTTDTVADRELGGIGCTSGSRGMCMPGGVAADKAGNVYVADLLNNRILEFNEPARRDVRADRVLDDQAATQFSEENTTHGGFQFFGGPLAVDPAGRLLVAQGGIVHVFERPLLPGAQSRKLIDISKVLYGLATDSAARIYLTADSHVYRFSSDGSGPSLQLGERCVYGNSTGVPEGLGRASLCQPTGLAVGPGNNEIFVSDAGANRVVVFDNR